MMSKNPGFHALWLLSPTRTITGFDGYVCAQSFSCLQLFGAPWTAALQAPLALGSSRQESWVGLSLPSLGESSGPSNQN